MIKNFIFRTFTGVSLLGIGYFAGKMSERRHAKYAGVLRIDKTEKDEPEKLFLELNNNLNDITKAKTIKLKVIRKNWL